jgi:hypothetical protein
MTMIDSTTKAVNTPQQVFVGFARSLFLWGDSRDLPSAPSRDHPSHHRGEDGPVKQEPHKGRKAEKRVGLTLQRQALGVNAFILTKGVEMKIRDKTRT